MHKLRRQHLCARDLIAIARGMPRTCDLCGAAYMGNGLCNAAADACRKSQHHPRATQRAERRIARREREAAASAASAGAPPAPDATATPSSAGPGPSSSAQPEPSDCVLISNLPLLIDPQNCEDVFSAYGAVLECKVMEPKNPWEKASALVRFGSAEEAAWVVENLGGNIPEGLVEPIVALFAEAAQNTGEGPQHVGPAAALRRVSALLNRPVRESLRAVPEGEVFDDGGDRSGARPGPPGLGPVNFL